MPKDKIILEGPEIKIIGKMGRFEIVKQVVNHFIDFEKDKKGKGIEFRYPVENLSIGTKLYIHRPGVKWNFDFKVEIPKNSMIEEGRHDQIALILRSIKNSNKLKFNQIWDVIYKLYHCINNDVDDMLSKISVSRLNNLPLDILLKVIKWLFIMEDIIYWHYEGRAFLYNFFRYVIFENDDERLKDTLNKVRERKIKPEGIKKLLKILGKGWEHPETKL